MICSTCHAEIALESQVCDRCGSEIAPRMAQLVPVEQRPSVPVLVLACISSLKS
ncbi:MAG: hypothetical protein O6826_08625 [Acidobacteria bacterium]|nr:hypothetical protein [Acidobacteriota bacterium]